MADLRWDLPETEEVEVDEETLARIDKGREDCRNGRWYTPEEVRAFIAQWTSNFESRKPR
jgi:predicted transcriptional regulator